MNAAIQYSVDACARVANLRDDLTAHGLQPEHADALARSLVSAQSCFVRFALLRGWTQIGPWSSIKLLRKHGLWSATHAR